MGQQNEDTTAKTGTGETGGDEALLAEYKARYLAALHKVQTAVAFEQNGTGTAPETITLPTVSRELKHQRVGIDSVKVEMGALSKLLVDKGVCTQVEVFRAYAEAMEAEALQRQSAISRSLGGADVRLG